MPKWISPFGKTLTSETQGSHSGLPHSRPECHWVSDRMAQGPTRMVEGTAFKHSRLVSGGLGKEPRAELIRVRGFSTNPGQSRLDTSESSPPRSLCASPANWHASELGCPHPRPAHTWPRKHCYLTSALTVLGKLPCLGVEL